MLRFLPATAILPRMGVLCAVGQNGGGVPYPTHDCVHDGCGCSCHSAARASARDDALRAVIFGEAHDAATAYLDMVEYGHVKPA